VRGLSVTDYLAPELANVNNPELRAVVLAFVAQILQSIDRNAALQLRVDSRRLCRDRSGIFSNVIFGSSAEALASAAEVERKVFGPTEIIGQVSEVIRGLARVVNALQDRHLAYAVDVAKRFAWTRTRIILLAAIYTTAENVGERGVMQDVANLANFPQSSKL
jgi:hypothetical protein